MGDAGSSSQRISKLRARAAAAAGATPPLSTMLSR